jgi:pimeloyl-ACP methyl ester carboxylesterase
MAPRGATALLLILAGILFGALGACFLTSINIRRPQLLPAWTTEKPQTQPQKLMAQVQQKASEAEMFRSKEPVPSASFAVRLRFLNDRIELQQKDWSPSKAEAAKKDLDAIESDMAEFAEGKTFLKPGKTYLMGYHSELDDSDQPYSLHIPKSYDGSSATPLVVLLHGQGMFNPLQCQAQPIGNMIVVAPQGRGGMDYMYVGEADVLRVIDEVQALLKIDENRVYLAGASMGGSGSWHLASKYPERFAGIMPLCGNTDINVWAELWKWTTPKDSPQAAVRQFLREDTCSVTYAENLINIPIVALQGEADPIVNQLHAKRMFEALQRSGHKNAKLHLLPLVTHNVSASYEQGLQNLVRVRRPLQIRYKTAWLKYPGTGWLRIVGFDKPLQHASFDAKAEPASGRITIKTTNVSDLQLDARLLPFEKLTDLRIDGRTVKLEEFTNVIELHRQDRGWTHLKKRETAGQKNSQIEGPVEHAFMSRFVLVSGEKSAAASASAADFVDLWKTRFAVPCRSKKDTDVTDADIADSNLILFGTREDNLLIARVLDKLPIVVEGKSIRFGGKLFDGPNLGAVLCYPNPLNPQRYVVLITGTTPEAYMDIHERFGNWFDWVPYDSRRHYDFAIFDDLTNGHHPESYLTWGFFDSDWQLNPATTFDAAPDWRKHLLPRVFPTMDLASSQDAQTVYLDQARTKKEVLNKEYLERNRSLEGTPLMLAGKEYARGLACRFPATITFDCAGFSKLRVTAGVEWDGKSELSEDRKRHECVTVNISGDGKKLFENVEPITYASQPLEIEVQLNGARTVTLAASGGLPWLNGTFIWANARLER